ncbi:MAG: spiro-SPASM protein [Treponema sp.]|jgi:spiro-SPASM protein|nr:spiro-SPASM protein [Treponema sp.]
MDNALVALFGGNLQKTAFQPLFSGKSAFDLAVEKSGVFPHVGKTLLLTNERWSGGSCIEEFETSEKIAVVAKDYWTKKALLETLARMCAGFGMVYFVWADTPFLDGELAGALAKRHTRYRADYTFADGYPAGLAPELLSPECIRRLVDIAGDDGAVERDAIFSVLQKDINAFDIETEIAPFDLRSRRLTFAADSKRNLLLLQRLFDAGFSDALDSEKFVEEKPEIFRTLPAFFPIQVALPCPQACKFCPYPRRGTPARGDEQDFMPCGVFERLLDKILNFSGDAVIDLSLWGELSLHPKKADLINAALERPALSLIIETSGVGWNKAELEALAEAEKAARIAKSGVRANNLPPLSWIVSLDAYDAARYREVRGAGYAEAVETVRTLAKLFPGNVYAQAVRTSGAEDDIERFYRFWKAEGLQVIIQKYDNFCGVLPSLRVSDLSPVERQPCWHLMRDMHILIDGAVPLCRETICAADCEGGAASASTAAALTGAVSTLGNAFSEDLETIWRRGNGVYMDHAACNYIDICTDCDEYYTYNI